MQRHRRTADAVWRLAGNSVVLQRLGSEPLRLTGFAALAWVALEHPMTGAELMEEIDDATGRGTVSKVDMAIGVEAALTLLRDHDLLEAAER